MTQYSYPSVVITMDITTVKLISSHRKPLSRKSGSELCHSKTILHCDINCKLKF